MWLFSGGYFDLNGDVRTSTFGMSISESQPLARAVLLIGRTWVETLRSLAMLSGHEIVSILSLCHTLIETCQTCFWLASGAI